MKWWKRMEQKIKNPEKSKKLMMWQAKYEEAKQKYAEDLNAMTMFDDYYIGDRKVRRISNSGNEDYAKKLAQNVRNITYELIESQVDSSIPMPKVEAVHEEDVETAKIIEDFLKNEVKLLKLKILNDQQERTTYIQGGVFSLIEWDNSKGYHCTIGDLSISDVHPRQVIPQPGVTDIDKMDYLFIRTPQTKEYVKRRFGVDVESENETDSEIRDGVTTDDIVTVVTCYYKNKDNCIGLYRWCGDVELEDYDDYQARHLTVCKRCGRIKDAEKCPECGGTTFVSKVDELDTIQLFKTVSTGFNMDGTPVVEEIVEELQLPFYKPNVFPLVLRKNISRDRKLLGGSDVDVIKDQQDTIKKLGSKINEKLLKGGSFVTLPTGVAVETTDEEFKIVRIDTPAQKNLIDVITVQADTTQDRATQELNYSWAKSSLGVTDAYQGKYDSSATSGTAKQYSINQAAGRLESKRVMKNEYFAKMYEVMFKFALAYADQPIPVNVQGTNGEVKFSHFNKADFIKYDSDGTPYWNDEFMFGTDPTSTLLTNREAMWNQADLKLQSGAFGVIGDDRTNHLYWLEQERNGYPHAGEILREIDARIEENKQLAEQMGGTENAMPEM